MSELSKYYPFGNASTKKYEYEFILINGHHEEIGSDGNKIKIIKNGIWYIPGMTSQINWIISEFDNGILNGEYKFYKTSDNHNLSILIYGQFKNGLINGEWKVFEAYAGFNDWQNNNLPAREIWNGFYQNGKLIESNFSKYANKFLESAETIFVEDHVVLSGPTLDIENKDEPQKIS